MASFNRIILVGNLTEDPEIRVTNGGISLSRFTVAVERPSRNISDTAGVDYIPVTVWRELAEEVQHSAKKGALVYLEGTVKTESFENQQGERRYSTKVEANRVKVLTGVAPVGTDSSSLPPLETDGMPLQASDFDFGSSATDASPVFEDEIPF